MFTEETAIDIIVPLFNRCMKKWGITPLQTLDVFKKYHLFSYVVEHQEDFNSSGIDGCILELERYINYQKTGKYERSLSNFKV